MGMIDINILKQIGNDVGMEMFDSLIEIFVADTSEKKETLKKLFEAGDISNLKITAHTLKSTCAQYGAMECSGIAKDLEKLCMDHPDDKDKMSSLVNQLSEKLLVAIEEIKTIDVQ